MTTQEWAEELESRLLVVHHSSRQQVISEVIERVVAEHVEPVKVELTAARTLLDLCCDAPLQLEIAQAQIKKLRAACAHLLQCWYLNKLHVTNRQFHPTADRKDRDQAYARVEEEYRQMKIDILGKEEISANDF